MCKSSTVWKFHDFSIIHILREINHGGSRSAKKCSFCHVWGSEMCESGQFQPSKNAKMPKYENSEPLNL